MSNFNSLADMGWHSFFQQQLSLDEWDEAIPARVVEQYKSEITVAIESGVFNISGSSEKFVGRNIAN